MDYTARLTPQILAACFDQLTFDDLGPVLVVCTRWQQIACDAPVYWSTISLTVRILFFFKRYSGLYFWSLIITTWMLSIREVGFLMRWVAPHVPWKFSLFLAEIGWTCMVTGYSIVLWSRISIIIQSRVLVWGILAVVLFDGFVFHTALWVLQYGLGSVKGAARRPWLRVLNPFERVQVTVFTVQECFISAVYMWGVWRLLKDQEHRTKRKRPLTLSCIRSPVSPLKYTPLTYRFTHAIMSRSKESVETAHRNARILSSIAATTIALSCGMLGRREAHAERW